jgi:hypothetical protein
MSTHTRSTEQPSVASSSISTSVSLAAKMHQVEQEMLQVSQHGLSVSRARTKKIVPQHLERMYVLFFIRIS